MPAHASTLNRGFADDVWYNSNGGAKWVPMTYATGARTVWLEVSWYGIEPHQPAPVLDPTNPAGPEYTFSGLDSIVREFAGSGLNVGMFLSGAPGWAEGPGGPANLRAGGAWRPNATAYGQAATALARRYSGSFPDPLHPGQTLPRVKYFQAWAEANFTVHLAPQWVRSGGKWVPASPGIYRSLLNSFYDGVKSVHSDNFVVTTGSGPYGDPPGGCPNTVTGPGCRMHPAAFVRSLLCLSGSKLKPASCPNPAKFDALAIDPYEVSAPTTRALNADDVSAPDLGKLTKIVKKAVRTGRALPRRHKQLWVTEFGYDSKPGNPHALSEATQARWLEQAFYLFWKQGVNTAIWYLVRDMGGTNYNTAYFSGVYTFSGQKKLSFTAYQFPFVVMTYKKATQAWGISPSSGRLSVQRKKGRSWKTLFRVSAHAGQAFVHKVSSRLHGKFRAVVAGQTSLVWHR